MVNGNRYDRDKNGISYLSPEPKKASILDRFEQKASKFKFLFALVCWIGVFFIAGVLVGETKEGHRKRDIFTETHLKQQDSLIKVQHQFMELYRVQRAADVYQYKIMFNRLYNADSVLMLSIDQLRDEVRRK